MVKKKNHCGKETYNNVHHYNDKPNIDMTSLHRSHSLKYKNRKQCYTNDCMWKFLFQIINTQLNPYKSKLITREQIEMRPFLSNLRNLIHFVWKESTIYA